MPFEIKRGFGLFASDGTHTAVQDALRR